MNKIVKMRQYHLAYTIWRIAFERKEYACGKYDNEYPE